MFARFVHNVKPSSFVDNSTASTTVVVTLAVGPLYQQGFNLNHTLSADSVDTSPLKDGQSNQVVKSESAVRGTSGRNRRLSRGAVGIDPSRRGHLLGNSLRIPRQREDNEVLSRVIRDEGRRTTRQCLDVQHPHNATFDGTPVGLDPFHYLMCDRIVADFDKLVPPFLDQKEFIPDARSELVSEVLALYDKARWGEALNLMKQEFPENDFHRHLFAHLRIKMDYPKRVENYRSVCRSSSFAEGSSSNSFLRRTMSILRKVREAKLLPIEERLLSAYATGLQRWCANAHASLVQKVLLTLNDSTGDAEPMDERYSEEHRKALQALLEATPAHTFAVKFLKLRCPLTWPWDSNPQRSHPQPSMPGYSMSERFNLRRLTDELNLVSWLLQNISPKQFLRCRHDFADTVKALEGTSPLVSVLETFCIPEAAGQRSDEAESRAAADDIHASINSITGTEVPTSRNLLSFDSG